MGYWLNEEIYRNAWYWGALRMIKESGGEERSKEKGVVKANWSLFYIESIIIKLSRQNNHNFKEIW